jgi:aspartyl-tRNA(Asn)/glutamyl-tRNA(Gln) amidotransferase subunit B
VTAHTLSYQRDRDTYKYKRLAPSRIRSTTPKYNWWLTGRITIEPSFLVVDGPTGSMARIAPRILTDYLFFGRVPSRGCLRAAHPQRRLALTSPHPLTQSNSLHTLHTQPDAVVSTSGVEDTTVAFRKQLKDEAKKRKAAEGPRAANQAKSSAEYNENWELTVGVEIHAQLNTARKLFSSATSTINEKPNTQVAFFDLAIPGSQPEFQTEILIPALRAAIALNCDIQQTSRFDRKHYFHWDQPAGYQITQYYQPFAKNGYITLYAHDGIAKEDGEEIRIGIKQIQMEQDTAKTITQPGDVQLVDFNRAGVPLIEIITLPQIHYPSTAAALVRKIQILLDSVDACVLGMESGGLRADVNVSVLRRDSHGDVGQEYAGVTGLGQRTEIKNLSSFRAVRDAIVAERDRQINILEAGGSIYGETRGWTRGNSETKRLRGKEGEVDYRYMPDPDLAPVIIGDDLLHHLKDNLGTLPDKELELLTQEFGLTMKDALTLVSLNDGGRVEYFYNVVDELAILNPDEDAPKRFGRVCGNWVLHELGGLVSETSEEEDALRIDIGGRCIIPADQLAQIINHLEAKLITGKTAKSLLSRVFDNETNGAHKSVLRMIETDNLLIRPMSANEYDELAKRVIEPKVIEQILKGKDGKVMYLVGRMMRLGEEGRVEPQEAERVIRKLIQVYKK